MTNQEKLLTAKLHTAIAEIQSWEREWDPKGATRFRKAYWNAFQIFLRRKRIELIQRLDAMKWIEVDQDQD